MSSSELKAAIESHDFYRSTFGRMLQTVIDYKYKPQPGDVNAAYQCQSDFTLRFLGGSTVSGFLLFQLSMRYNIPQNIYAKYVWGFVGGMIGGYYVARTAGANCLGYIMANNTPLAREVEEIIRSSYPNHSLLSKLPIISEENRVPSISQLAREDPARLAYYQDHDLHRRTGTLQTSNRQGQLDSQRAARVSRQEQGPVEGVTQDQVDEQEGTGMQGIFGFGDESQQQQQQQQADEGTPRRRGNYKRLPPAIPSVPPLQRQQQRGDEFGSSEGGLIIKEEDEFQKGFEGSAGFDEGLQGRGRRGNGGESGAGGSVLGEFS
eukprot:TRINITY_DN33790_c0_g1_i1.p1 TRINITY_DN33790_c0_g1~~TRINITY_DN33790_c0_g1_i1.p1  ORF type:complete len:320 (-),score=33.97 TRINITY_DN33790_c0_g1_i1:198-1157(-)